MIQNDSNENAIDRSHERNKHNCHNISEFLNEFVKCETVVRTHKNEINLNIPRGKNANSLSEIISI